MVEKKFDMNNKEEKIKDLFARLTIDMVKKWGDRYINDNSMATISTKEFGARNDYAISVDIRPNQQKIIIQKGDKRTRTLDDVFGNYITIMLQEKNVVEKSKLGLSYVNHLENGFILIEQGIDIADIFINTYSEIYQKANQDGMIDQDNNLLKREEFRYLVLEKYKVDEFFKKRGSLIPLGPGWKLEKVTEEFSDPENLIKVKDPFSGEIVGVAHKRDDKYFKVRETILTDVLIEKNTNIIDLLAFVEKEPTIFGPLLMNIKKEVDRRVDQYFKNKEEISG